MEGILEEIERRRNRRPTRNGPLPRAAPITQLPKARPPEKLQFRGLNDIPIGLECNACHNRMPRGTKMLFKRFLRSINRTPIDQSAYKIYLNCTTCSAEMVIQPHLFDYVAVKGATQYVERTDGCEEILGNPYIKRFRRRYFKGTPGSTDTPDGPCDSSTVGGRDPIPTSGDDAVVNGGGDPIPTSGDDAVVNEGSSQLQRWPN